MKDQEAMNDEEIGGENLIKFKVVKSNASFNVKDIKGFIYGGLSSRFWMLRKHTNFLDKNACSNLPFYAWQCITIITKYREIDLVIQNEEHLILFIKYLIWQLESVDGIKKSARPIIDALNNDCQEKIRLVTQCIKISPGKCFQINQMNQQQLYTKIGTKYFILKIRLKLSYCAMIRGITIVEMFL